MKNQLIFIFILNISINSIQSIYNYQGINNLDIKQFVPHQKDSVIDITGNVNFENNQNYSDFDTQSKIIGKIVRISKPVVAQRLISAPVIRRRIISQPIITKKVIKKKIFRSIKNNAALIKNNLVNKNINVTIPARKINNSLIIRPRIHTNNVDIDFHKLPAKRIIRETQTGPLKITNQQINKIINLPAEQNYYHKIIKPNIHTTREEVNFRKLPSQFKNISPENLNVINKYNNQNRIVNAPGNLTHNFTINKPLLRKENVVAKFNKLPLQIFNNDEIVEDVNQNIINRIQQARIEPEKTIIQPIVQNIIRDRTMNHITRPIFKKVVVVKKIKTPVNIIQKVPVINKIRVPVRTQGNVSIYKGDEYWDDRYSTYNQQIKDSLDQQSFMPQGYQGERIVNYVNDGMGLVKDHYLDDSSDSNSDYLIGSSKNGS